MFNVYYCEESGYFQFKIEKQDVASATDGLRTGICYYANNGSYALEFAKEAIQIAVAYKSANFVNAQKSMVFLFTAEGRPPVVINGESYPSPILLETEDYQQLRDGIISALQAQGIMVLEHDEYTVV